MPLKAVEIARRLGISKATVSLALNNKPGVKAETREMILRLKEQLESRSGAEENLRAGSPYAGGVIKVLQIKRGFKVISDDDLNFWSIVKPVYDRIAESWGCSVEGVYFDLRKDNPAALIDECSDEQVLGVVVCGAEFIRGDEKIFAALNKPVVIYDYDPGSSFASVQCDNFAAAAQIVDYLSGVKITNVLYAARSVPIYNYLMRRRGFEQTAPAAGIPVNIFEAGVTISEIYRSLVEKFSREPVPAAIVTESYHATIAAINACSTLQIKCPEQIRIIGIDELPSSMTGGMEASHVRIPHESRAQWIMQLLKLEIDGFNPVRPKIFIPCELKIRST